MACALAGVVPAAEPPQHPDVILIIVDDLNTNLGCYGDTIAKTPHIDRLAARGVRFDDAFCQYPLCNPSRSSFLSGLRPASTGVFSNDIDWRKRLAGAVTLPQFFKEQGYETLSIGKIFHGGDADPSRWSAPPHRPGQEERKAPPGNRLSRGPDPGPTGIGNPLQWGPSGLDPEDEPDGRIAAAAAKLLVEKRDKPLFLAVGISRPHLPFTAPKKFFDMHPAASLRLPETRPDDLDDLPVAAAADKTEFKGLSEQDLRAVRAAYAASVSFMDDCVGQVLAALDRSGRADRTIVILVGDHGLLLGEHFQFRKWSLFTESVRVPFIVAAPGHGKSGTVVKGLAELVDLYPTLADLAGFPAPKHLEGISLVPLLDAPERPWKKAVFSEVHRRDAHGVSIRTTRWRYTEWNGPDAAELYDLEADTHEFTNLAKDPDRAEMVKELRALLTAGWKGALPPPTRKE